MKVFWRDTPLTEAETKLLNLTLEAHSQSAMRDNVSSVVLAQTAQGSGDLTKAITAALATLGGRHAPLTETHQFLTTVTKDDIIDPEFERFPGWGNSFVKGKPDELWKDVDAQLGEVAPELYAKIAYITTALHDSGKHVFPNPSAYTAAVGIALSMPPRLLPWLFIQGRLSAWTALFQSVTKGVE